MLVEQRRLILNLQKAEEQYKRTTKKFGQSSKVWTLFGEFCMRRGKLEDARKMLPRSLQSLEKRKRELVWCADTVFSSLCRRSENDLPLRATGVQDG
jgi:hypothetical protein